MHVSVCTLAMLHILNNAPDMGPAWRTAVVGAFVLICLAPCLRNNTISLIFQRLRLGAAVYSIHAIVFS